MCGPLGVKSNAFCSGGFGLELDAEVDVSLEFRFFEGTQLHGVLPL